MIWNSDISGRLYIKAVFLNILKSFLMYNLWLQLKLSISLQKVKVKKLSFFTISTKIVYYSMSHRVHSPSMKQKINSRSSNNTLLPWRVHQSSPCLIYLSPDQVSNIKQWKNHWPFFCNSHKHIWLWKPLPEGNIVTKQPYKYGCYLF